MGRNVEVRWFDGWQTLRGRSDRKMWLVRGRGAFSDATGQLRTLSGDRGSFDLHSKGGMVVGPRTCCKPGRNGRKAGPSREGVRDVSSGTMQGPRLST